MPAYYSKRNDVVQNHSNQQRLTGDQWLGSREHVCLKPLIFTSVTMNISQECHQHHQGVGMAMYMFCKLNIYIHAYIHTFHSIPFHSIPLHCITLHYITLHSIPLHYITSHSITLHYITIHHITLHSITLHIYIYVHIHTHAYIYVRMYVCMYKYMYTCADTYT